VSPAGGLLLAGVVTAAGSDDELAVAASLGVDADSAITASGFGRGGLVADGVLVAYVASHGTADRIDLFQGAREEGDASGALGHGFEGALGSALAFFAEYSDGIHRRSIFFLQPAHRLFQRFAAGIVFAIGH